MQIQALSASWLNNKSTITAWMNHLAIIYAFLLPISHYAGSFIFSLILILFIIRRNLKEYLLPAFKNKVVQAFIIFYLINILWLFGTENFDQAKQVLKFSQYALFPILFLAFIDKRFSPYIIGGFITGILFSEFISYSIQFNLIPWKLAFFSIPIYQAYDINDPSPFLHHSFYASSLAFISALLIYKYLTKNPTLLEKAISLLFIISISINLATVGGRVGYILYIVLILFSIYYIYGKKNLSSLIVAFIGIASFFITAYTYSPIFKNKIKETQHITKEFLNGKMNFHDSLGSRIGFSYYATQVINTNFLLGVGTGDYMDEVKKIIPNTQNNTYIKNTLEHPHNIYIMLLLQFGIIGLLAFLNIFYQLYRYKNSDDYLKFVKYSIMLTIAVALITETFTAPYYFPLFVLIVSSTLSTENLPKEFTCNFSKKTYIYYIVLVCLAAINAKLHFIIALLKTST